VGQPNQFESSGGIFYLTHRCHNRAFLLKFARDRGAYRAVLREQLKTFEVWLPDYHVHLLLDGGGSAPDQRVNAERGGRVRPSLQPPQRADERFFGETTFMLERIKQMVLSRRDTEVTEIGEGLNVLDESSSPYAQETALKTARKFIL
jgi:hypothetical protein